MRNLYARIVLWLIRPALELHSKKTHLQRMDEIDETVFSKLLMGKSMIKDALRDGYGIKMIGKD